MTTLIRRKEFTATDLALVAVFAALIAVLSLVPGINVGVGVPITLQTLGVALAGLTLGPLRGSLAALLYLAVGFIGLPVFAGGTAGLAVLAKPSAGYLLSFPIAALVAGLLAGWLTRTRLPHVVALFLAGLGASFLVIHPMGIIGLMANAGLTIQGAFLVDVTFWPGDVVKNVVAAAIATSVHTAFPALIAGRRSVREEPATA